MNIEEAKKILSVTDIGDRHEIKLKFRQLIGRYHPDAIGADSPESTQRAQKINEAYKILKHHSRIAEVKEDIYKWNGTINETAFTPRNIYMEYSMDEPEANGLYHSIANGKYMWDPDEEEFDLFLRSLNHASQELLTAIEMPYHISDDYSPLKDIRFSYQVSLFQFLALQFIDPISCLNTLSEPAQMDQEGRNIYRFRAFLSVKGSSLQFQNVERLNKNDILYPVSLQNNRIMVANEDRKGLGYLLLEEDAMYFCLIPLLKEKKAQLKLTVNEVFVNRKRRPYQAKATVDMLVRLERKGAEPSYAENKCKDINQKITILLSEYEKQIRSLNEGVIHS